jgi:hypothetical protein
MRIALPIVLALSAILRVLQRITWSVSLKGGDLSVDTAKLMGVRLASQSMGYLAVLGPIVFEVEAEPPAYPNCESDGQTIYENTHFTGLSGGVEPLVREHLADLADGRAYSSDYIK